MTYISKGVMVEIVDVESDLYKCQMYVAKIEIDRNKNTTYYLGGNKGYLNKKRPTDSFQGPFTRDQISPLYSQNKVLEKLIEKANEIQLEWINLRLWLGTESGSVELFGKNKTIGIEHFSLKEGTLQDNLIKTIEKVQLINPKRKGPKLNESK